MVRLVVGPWNTAGARTVDLVYLGDAHTLGERTATTVTVINGNP